MNAFLLNMPTAKVKWIKKRKKMFIYWLFISSIVLCMRMWAALRSAWDRLNSYYNNRFKYVCSSAYLSAFLYVCPSFCLFDIYFSIQRAERNFQDNAGKYKLNWKIDVTIAQIKGPTWKTRMYENNFHT